MTLGVVLAGVVGVLRIETTDAEQVYHLLVHLFLTIDESPYHLLGIGIDGRQVEVELHMRLLRCSRDIHDAVNTNVITTETLSYLQVRKGNAADGV